METIRCQCGEILSERCEWVGPRSETVEVRYIPEHLVITAEMAGQTDPLRSAYAHPEALRVERGCAEILRQGSDIEDLPEQHPAPIVVVVEGEVASA